MELEPHVYVRATFRATHTRACVCVCTRGTAPAERARAGRVSEIPETRVVCDPTGKEVLYRAFLNVETERALGCPKGLKTERGMCL